MPNYQAALIDLDGTLVDTLSEITAAVNALLADMGRPPVDERTINEAVGEGAANLLRKVLGTDDVDPWMAGYMTHYGRINGTLATLYPNVVEGLEAMKAANLSIACVTNKPRELVAPLFEHLGIRPYFDCLVGGGDTVEKKPKPAPLLFACERLGVAPERCVMIGDSKNDAIAAGAAGLISLTVPYGYPGSSGAEDRAEGLLERGITCAIVRDLLDAARWIASADTSSAA